MSSSNENVYHHQYVMQVSNIHDVKQPRYSMYICHTHARTHAHTHACTHAGTHAQPFYSSLDSVWDNPGEPVPEEKHSPIHTYQLSSVIPYLLPLSITIHGVLHVQFMCLTVFFHNLSPTFLWSTS